MCCHCDTSPKCGCKHHWATSPWRNSTGWNLYKSKVAPNLPLGMQSILAVCETSCHSADPEAQARLACLSSHTCTTPDDQSPRRYANAALACPGWAVIDKLITCELPPVQKAVLCRWRLAMFTYNTWFKWQPTNGSLDCLHVSHAWLWPNHTLVFPVQLHPVLLHITSYPHIFLSSWWQQYISLEARLNECCCMLAEWK